MSFFYTILSSFWFEVIIRLILGFLLAGFIGAERESVNNVSIVSLREKYSKDFSDAVKIFK